MTDGSRKRALAKLGYVECVCVKAEHTDDWYSIERAEHDGRVWQEPTEYGSSLMASARISDADVEGTAEHMLAIADAIERRQQFSAKRCAVAVSGDMVSLWSPKNSREAGHIPLAAADKLAESIRTVVKIKDPAP